MKTICFIVITLILHTSLMGQYGSLTISNNNYEYITNVSFSNVNNTTDATASEYEYYSNQIAYVNKGKTITLSVTIHPDYDDYVYAWIDWNHNYTFETSERYILAELEDNSGPFTEDILVPNTTYNGLTRMRIVLSWDDEPIATGSFTYGEAEDYQVNVSPYNYIYLGGWDANGLPDYLESTGDAVPPETLELIEEVLPEGVPNLDYIDYNDYLNVTVDTGTRVWASFIHEDAGYKNTFAMYQYPVNDPPLIESDIDSLTIIFPNTSLTGSGGSLTRGDKIYYDSVPAGTVIAFAIIANAFSNSHTNTTINNQGNDIFYSNNNLNPETPDSLKAHNVTFWDSQQEKYILGFDDINRNNSSCDHDFNDVIYYITLDPIPLFDDTLNEMPPDIEDPDETGLPVTWLGFEGTLHNQEVVLRWYVASQINNDYFLVERSQNMMDWEVINEVDGHGTTTQLIRYTATDAQPLIGETYYRIKQIDFDGKFDYSKTISINYTGNDDFIALFPNPVEDNILNIRLEGLTGMMNLEIYDNRGVLVKSENFESLGNLTYKIDTSPLSNGLYYLSMSNGLKKVTKKFLINR